MNENEHCIKAIVINGKCFRENVPVFLFCKVGYVLIEKKYLNFLFQTKTRNNGEGLFNSSRFCLKVTIYF